MTAPGGTTVPFLPQKNLLIVRESLRLEKGPEGPGFCLWVTFWCREPLSHSEHAPGVFQVFQNWADRRANALSGTAVTMLGLCHQTSEQTSPRLQQEVQAVKTTKEAQKIRIFIGTLGWALPHGWLSPSRPAYLGQPSHMLSLAHSFCLFLPGRVEKTEGKLYFT